MFPPFITAALALLAVVELRERAQAATPGAHPGEKETDDLVLEDRPHRGRDRRSDLPRERTAQRDRRRVTDDDEETTPPPAPSVVPAPSAPNEPSGALAPTPAPQTQAAELAAGEPLVA